MTIQSKISWFMLPLLMLTGCQSIDLQNIELKQVADIAIRAAKIGKTSEKEEIAIGRQSTAVLLGALGDKPVYSNSNVQNYVNLIGSHVASKSHRSNLSWHFVVSNDPDVNAFAAPGGYIVVTLGLLAELENEAQLAAVIAHEIVHVEEKHHLKIMQANGWLTVASDAAMIVYTSGDEEPKLDPKVAERILNATKTVYSKGLDKKDEYAADKRALKLLSDAGYDAYALVDVLQKLDANSAQDSKLALMLKTHPTPRSRLERLAGLMPESGLQEGKTLEERFQSSIQ